MTISLAWIRSVGATNELVFATDSRLRFGCAWDCGLKILTMSRSDVAICFAGDTDYAYPLMLQMSSAIAHYSRSRNRAMDLFDLKGHILRVFNSLRSLLSDLPKGSTSPDPPKATFIFGGYSWQKKKLAVWLLHFDARIGKFTFRRAKAWPGSGGKKFLVIAGDYESEVRSRLIQRLRAKGKLPTGGFDMEPFEVLRDILRSGDYPYVGGAPQVVKIYEHMNNISYGVYWPNRTVGRVTLLGRPLLQYEKMERLILDPDTLRTYSGSTGLVFAGGKKTEPIAE